MLEDKTLNYMATFWNTFIIPNEDSAAIQETCAMCHDKKKKKNFVKSK